jgi:RecQ family ATP-dependent DNA helicase
MLWTDKVKKYLKKYWKIESLKEKQVEVINELLLGNDVIGLLPTGYGKSLCYLLPPLITKKTIFIISPLISLMDDQKEKLNKMNIPCVALHGNNKNKDQEIFKIIDGDIKIVYMSPEYLIKSDGLDLAKTLIDDNKLGFFAVDESHCISVWGQDFRPDYTKIKTFRELFPQIPIIAVTATATDAVCQDITKMLGLKNPSLVRASFDRPNLFIKVQEIPTISVIEKSKKGNKFKNIQKTVAKEQLVLQWIKKYPGEKIIVYTNSRKDSEELAIGLNKLINNCCEAYHAGLTKELREQIQSKFTDGEIKVIISTIAFGMGIDQKIRVVIIFGCPSSIEEYYQQIGRCGRDNIQSDTILYFDYKNLIIGKHMLRDIKIKWPALYKSKIDNLNKIGKFAYLNTCRRKYILEYFNESCDFFTCGNCDNCCEQEMIDMTEKIWPIIMRPNTNLFGVVNEIKNKYLTTVIELDKNNKDKVIDLDLFEPIWKWKNYITKNNITRDNLPSTLKINIPSKFIKKVESNLLEKSPLVCKTFEDKINIYEKILSK